MSLHVSRIHYSRGELSLDRKCKYTQTVSLKPEGLWYSVGTSWEEWCKGEDFKLDDLDSRRALDLKIDRMLQLGCRQEIVDFGKEYGVTLSGKECYIDWPAVAHFYSGIEISPYCWEERHSTLWYYGWDCASGCVWDLDTIIERED